MALKKVYFGSIGPLVYDDTIPVNDPDGDFAGEDHQSITTDGQLRVEQAPAADEEVVRLSDLGFRLLPPVSVVNIGNPTELNAIAGNPGTLVLAYQIVGATGRDRHILYAYDASGPAVIAPYVMDADGAADERWIAIAGEYNIYISNVVYGAGWSGVVNVAPSKNAVYDIIQLHTKAILTAQGDIVYASAANVLARLALDGADKKLFTNAGNTAPEWSIGIKIGQITRDTALASGNQIITGVGFKASNVIFLCTVHGTTEMSIGFDNSTLHHLLNHQPANTWGISSVKSLMLDEGGGVWYNGYISGFNSDGFQISWLKSGAKTGLAYIYYIAFR